jgi:uncharacterized membrane protein
MNKSQLTIGQRLADTVSNGVGSWMFIVIQSVLLAIWIVINAYGIVKWDSFPFFFLNLALSFEAAFTAPFILMSQGRQSSIDRATLEADLDANIQELAKLDAIEIRLSEHIEAQISDLAVKLEKVIVELHNAKQGKPAPTRKN